MVSESVQTNGHIPTAIKYVFLIGNDDSDESYGDNMIYLQPQVISYSGDHMKTLRVLKNLLTTMIVSEMLMTMVMAMFMVMVMLMMMVMMTVLWTEAMFTGQAAPAPAAGMLGYLFTSDCLDRQVDHRI